MDTTEEKPQTKKKASKKAASKSKAKPKIEGSLVLVGKAPWGAMREPVKNADAAALIALKWRVKYEPQHKIALSLVETRDDGSTVNLNEALFDAMEEARIEGKDQVKDDE